MGCFTDIIKHAMQNNNGIGLIIFYCFVISIAFIYRNYLLGQLVQNLDIKDLYKYVGATVITYIAHVLIN